LLAAGLLLFILSAPVSAIDMTEAVHLEWEKSDILKAQENLYTISRTDLWRQYLPSSPQLQISSGDDMSSLSYGVAVNLPVKTLRTRKLTAAIVNQQRVELDAKKYELAKMVILAYLDCATQHAITVLQEKSIGDLDTLHKSLKKRFEDGYSNLSDVLGSELQLRDAEIALRESKDRYQTAKENLRKLLKIQTPLADDFVLDDDLKPELVSEIGIDTADHLRAKAGLDVAKASADTAHWQQLPDLNLGASYNTYPHLPASPSGRPSAWSYTFGVTVPFMFNTEAERTKNQSILDRSGAELQIIQSEIDQKDAAMEYSRSIALLKELREKEIPLVQMLVSTTLSDYITGKVGFAELMQARKSLVDISTREIQTRSSIIMSHLRSLTLKLSEGSQDNAK
jgi:outer membrane protein TolC